MDLNVHRYAHAIWMWLTCPKEMTHDLEMNFNKIAPFGKEDTAKELQDHAAKTQDTLVDAVENAEVAEIKRAVFRALTRLRAATIKEWCSEKEKQFTFKLTEIDKCDLISLEAQLKNLKDFHCDEKPPKETEQDAVR